MGTSAEKLRPSLATQLAAAGSSIGGSPPEEDVELSPPLDPPELLDAIEPLDPPELFAVSELLDPPELLDAPDALDPPEPLAASELPDPPELLDAPDALDSLPLALDPLPASLPESDVSPHAHVIPVSIVMSAIRNGTCWHNNSPYLGIRRMDFLPNTAEA